MENENESEKTAAKKPKRLKKFIIIFTCVLVVLSLAWVIFSMVGRIDAASVIPGSADFRISISNPMRFIDNLSSHESLHEFSHVPALAFLTPLVNSFHDAAALKNPLVRLAAMGKIEAALLPSEIEDESGKLIAAWDMGFFSPLLRILPVVTVFVNIPNLYYVQSGSSSRYEIRTEDMTFFIAPYRNLLFITNCPKVFESRGIMQDHAQAFEKIKPSVYDAALVLSNNFIINLLSDQAPSISEILKNVEFESKVEAGISVSAKKFEFHLTAPLTSRQDSLSRILAQRSRTPNMAELIPADAQYATIMSAGTLNELYQTTLIFAPDMDETLKTADNTSRFLLGLTLNDLLFSWSGNEFAAFGIEGRPHPIYAIQINDERKRQEVFDKAFRSIVLNENVG
ncbi:MAG: hypothetical protein FWD47_05150 [Treponema sp.]|nr:hypothetical protein [Treponema sp.]